MKNTYVRVNANRYLGTRITSSVDQTEKKNKTRSESSRSSIDKLKNFLFCYDISQNSCYVFSSLLHVLWAWTPKRRLLLSLYNRKSVKCGRVNHNRIEVKRKNGERTTSRTDRQEKGACILSTHNNE